MAIANPTDYSLCHLCKGRVYMDGGNEFMILILSKNSKSSRIIFHCDCFFDAAGPEYKIALEYNKLSTPMPIPNYNPSDSGIAQQMKKQQMQNMYGEQQKQYIDQFDPTLKDYSDYVSNTMSNHYNQISDHYKKAHDIIMQEMIAKQKADKP